MKHILAVLVLLPICLVLRLAAQAPGQQPPAQKNTAQPSPQQGATYVGQDTCIGCHDAEGKQIHGTAHGKSENPRSPAAAHGCESCHGPGSAHVEDPSKPGSIKRFTTLPAREASDTCLTCHSRGAHVNWKGSMHDERNLSCITCHSVHNPKSETAQLKTATVIETCKTCHKKFR